MSQRQPTTSHERLSMTFTFDPDAYELLMEMSKPRNRGAFICGLIRVEYERQQERWKRRSKDRRGEVFEPVQQ